MVMLPPAGPTVMSEAVGESGLPPNANSAVLLKPSLSESALARAVAPLKEPFCVLQYATQSS